MMKTTAFAVLTTLALTAAAAAHHSFAPFNLETEKTISGVVKVWEWTNPHTWLWVDVRNEKGATETWGIEGMSPNYLGRRGWSKDTFKAGDKVTITVRPMKDGSPGGMFVRGTTADGKQLTFAATAPN
jgi:hypothetical protein